MHGIEVRRRPESDPKAPRSGGMRIRQIHIRYEDGRTATFIPEMQSEFFSKDSIDRLVGSLQKASAVLEWGQVSGEVLDAEQGRGLI